MKECTAGEENVARGDLCLSPPSSPLSRQLRMFKVDRTNACDRTVMKAPVSCGYR